MVCGFTYKYSLTSSMTKYWVYNRYVYPARDVITVIFAGIYKETT